MFTGEKRKNDKKIIFIDVDDTLADTRRGIYDLYVTYTGDESGDINTKTKRYKDFCPEWSDANIDKVFINPTLLYDMTKPMAGAKEAVSALLQRGYDLRIVTLQVASGIPAKQKWIEQHFPELSNMVYYLNNVSANKDVFAEYSMIDDNNKNIATNGSEKPLLLDVYGIYPTLKTQWNYCGSWKEVVDKLK